MASIVPESISPPGESSRHGIMRAGSLYAVSGVAQRSVAIVLLPFFVRWLTPSEYGQVGLLAAFSALALYLFPLGLEAVVTRGWFDHESRADRLRYAADVQRLLLVAPLVMVLPLAGLLSVVGATRAVPFALSVAAVGGAALFVMATTVPYSVLRVERRAGSYVCLTLVYLTLQVGLRVVLVGMLHRGVAGWVAADVVSAMVLLMAAPRIAEVSLWTRRTWGIARRALRSGVPLVPHGLGQWSLALSDRLILVHAVSLAAIGVYSVGYQTGVVLIMLFTELNRAVSPEYAVLGSSDAAQSDGVRRLVAAQGGTVVVAGLAAAIIAPTAIRVLLPDSYAGAAGVAPWVALGAVFVGLYQISMNHLTLVLGQTNRIWFAAVAATVTNVALNLLTVRRFGIMAAAVNTAIAYGLLLVLVRWYEIRRTGNPLRPDRTLVGLYLWLLAAALVLAAGVVALPVGVPALVLAVAVGGSAVVGALLLFRRAEPGLIPNARLA